MKTFLFIVASPFIVLFLVCVFGALQPKERSESRSAMYLEQCSRTWPDSPQRQLLCVVERKDRDGF